MVYAKIGSYAMIARITGSDWFWGISFALLIVGALAVFYAVSVYIDASLKIEDNAAYRLRQQGGQLEVDSVAQGQSIMVADLEYRRLKARRNDALIYGGAGLAVLALGWITFDLSRAQRRKIATGQPQSAAG